MLPEGAMYPIPAPVRKHPILSARKDCLSTETHHPPSAAFVPGMSTLIPQYSRLEAPLCMSHDVEESSPSVKPFVPEQLHLQFPEEKFATQSPYPQAAPNFSKNDQMSGKKETLSASFQVPFMLAIVDETTGEEWDAEELTDPASTSYQDRARSPLQNHGEKVEAFMTREDNLYLTEIKPDVTAPNPTAPRVIQMSSQKLEMKSQQQTSPNAKLGDPLLPMTDSVGLCLLENHLSPHIQTSEDKSQQRIQFGSSEAHSSLSRSVLPASISLAKTSVNAKESAMIHIADRKALAKKDISASTLRHAQGKVAMPNAPLASVLEMSQRTNQKVLDLGAVTLAQSTADQPKVQGHEMEAQQHATEYIRLGPSRSASDSCKDMEPSVVKTFQKPLRQQLTPAELPAVQSESRRWPLSYSSAGICYTGQPYFPFPLAESLTVEEQTSDEVKDRSASSGQGLNAQQFPSEYLRLGPPLQVTNTCTDIRPSLATRLLDPLRPQLSTVELVTQEAEGNQAACYSYTAPEIPSTRQTPPSVSLSNALTVGDQILNEVTISSASARSGPLKENKMQHFSQTSILEAFQITQNTSMSLPARPGIEPVPSLIQSGNMQLPLQQQEEMSGRILPPFVRYTSNGRPPTTAATPDKSGPTLVRSTHCQMPQPQQEKILPQTLLDFLQASQPPLPTLVAPVPSAPPLLQPVKRQWPPHPQGEMSQMPQPLFCFGPPPGGAPIPSSFQPQPKSSGYVRTHPIISRRRSQLPAAEPQLPNGYGAPPYTSTEGVNLSEAGHVLQYPNTRRGSGQSPAACGMEEITLSMEPQLVAPIPPQPPMIQQPPMCYLPIPQGSPPPMLIPSVPVAPTIFVPSPVPSTFRFQDYVDQPPRQENEGGPMSGMMEAFKKVVSFF